MAEIGIAEAKNHLSRLLRHVQEGERFIITKHSRPVAELIPFQPRDSDEIPVAIAALKAFRETHSLEGQSVRRMIAEGRKH